MIWIGICDPRSLGSWCIKGPEESTLVTDSSGLMPWSAWCWITDPDSDHPINVPIIPEERMHPEFIKGTDESVTMSGFIGVSVEAPWPKWSTDARTDIRSRALYSHDTTKFQEEWVAVDQKPGLRVDLMSVLRHTFLNPFVLSSKSPINM